MNRLLLRAAQELCDERAVFVTDASICDEQTVFITYIRICAIN
ncbi:MAG: hypothetical protein PHD46_07720 [Eubacteriales bacterium]|nr:hypothetical protein [Eubacteriales bacterium]